MEGAGGSDDSTVWQFSLSSLFESSSHVFLSIPLLSTARGELLSPATSASLRLALIRSSICHR